MWGGGHLGHKRAGLVLSATVGDFFAILYHFSMILTKFGERGGREEGRRHFGCKKHVRPCAHVFWQPGLTPWVEKKCFFFWVEKKCLSPSHNVFRPQNDPFPEMAPPFPRSCFKSPKFLLGRKEMSLAFAQCFSTQK